MLWPFQAPRPGVFDCSIARWSAHSAARLWPHKAVGYKYDKTEETEWEYRAQTVFLIYLFINVLFSQREADRQTGSYTLLLDDFLCWVNTFQLRSNMSACKVFWINTYRHRQLLDFIAQKGGQSGWALLNRHNNDFTFILLQTTYIFYILSASEWRGLSLHPWISLPVNICHFFYLQWHVSTHTLLRCHCTNSLDAESPVIKTELRSSSEWLKVQQTAGSVALWW